MCNATANLTNYLTINMPCYLEAGGFTSIYSLSTSGGVGGNDTTNPTITFNSPTANSNTSDNTPTLNISFADLNGTGLDNNSINITVNGTTYANILGNLSCIPNTQNMSNSTCTMTTHSLPDGSININL